MGQRSGTDSQVEVRLVRLKVNSSLLPESYVRGQGEEKGGREGQKKGKRVNIQTALVGGDAPGEWDEGGKRKSRRGL